MHFNALLTFLESKAPGSFLSKDLATTLELAKQPPENVGQEIVQALVEHCQIKNGDMPLERAQAVNALGKIRLKYMKDDAPVDGFRLVEKTIQWIDDAFNEEAWQARQK
jgi:hypothetical protein